MIKKVILPILITLVIANFSIKAQNLVILTDESIKPGQTYNLTKDKQYMLDGFVFVEDGAVLNIEAGTVIKAMQGEAENASALIIAKGGKINANGTKENPIIFTSELDDVTDPTDLPIGRAGLWGGIIVLGNAPINTPGGTEQIEGIPSNEPRGSYGGTDEADNSGVLRYVSIRHGGTNIGANNEINGLTLGGVGNGTTVEFVEIYANSDDGVEFFGGTVNTKNIAVVFCEDDSFDWDEGYRGNNQFWFSIQSPTTGNNMGENDGATDPEDSEPYAMPLVYNATYIGSGLSSARTQSRGFHIRDNSGGYYKNSIITDLGGAGLDIEDLADTSAEDSRKRLEAGEIQITNNIWYNIGDNSLNGISPDVSGSNPYSQDFVRTYLGANNNYIENPRLAGISRTNNGGLDPRPNEGAAWTNERANYPQNPFFVKTSYIGAFGEENWLEGWTFLSEAGFLGDLWQGRTSSEITVTDASINAGETYNMTKNNTYILDGFVFVESGATLNIEAGTIIKAKQGEAENASALIIAKGGKINANGTKDNPIIFTSELDDVNDYNDLPIGRAGLWGGLIVLGNAPINTPGGTEQIEGIPSNEPRGSYGGTDEADNSGVIRYVSLRHGGTNIGANNEINGLTLGGVGNGTTIEFVEIYANSDDGVEFFGGTVNTKNIAVVFCEDDSFDWDEGYRGNNQFWFSIQSPTTGNNMGENDGATDPEDSQPYAMPLVYNATYIGSGLSSARTQSRGFHIRDNSGGYYKNSIITELGGAGLDIEDLDDAAAEDSRKRLEAGEIQITNNIWYNIGDNTLNGISPDVTGSKPYSQDFVRTYLGENNNYIENPMLAGISRTNNGGLDPRPNEGAAWTNDRAEYPTNPFFVKTSYIGAFGEENWLEGWSFLSKAGFMGDLWQGRTSSEITVTDATINAGETYNMTKNNTYILDGFVFVESGATLNIEAGTVIKAKQGEAENASALIIAKGGKINANGTKDEPIIFTSELDDVTVADDLPIGRAGLWGGLIVLGNAPINTPGGTEQIEGIPSNEPRGSYGGTNAADNSGVIRYVSLRHGGTNIGANNEINGLTLGGVGNGTTVEYVEIYANSDDGVEFFGGTVNTKNIAVVFCEDDSFDWDEGYRGNNQFWFSIQSPTTGNNMGENDGATDPEDSQPYAMPLVYNATYIGSGMSSARTQSRGFHIRDNSGGYYKNCIITELGGAGLDIEDLDDAAAEDSRKRLEAGEIQITNNIWYNIGGNTLEGIAPDVTGSKPYSQDFVRTYLADNNNYIEDPMLAGISRTNNGGLDPRPNPGSAWNSGRAALPQGNNFFTNVNYIGAFGEDNWLEGWTFLSEAGFLGDLYDPNAGGGEIIVRDNTINAGETYNMTSNNTYILEGFVFVEEGATLNIQAGTVIKAKQGEAENASALIIAKGGKINANGTKDKPIIFTSELDDVTVADDLPIGRAGLWGGLIVLGNAPINTPGGTEQIEGIPSNEPRGSYGGTNEADNSGVIRYVSIRHGGTNIGANNEINGLTLGGVGNGTTVEYVEIYANSDDGVEFFGGTVNTKNIAVVFCEDDSFDWDEGYRGNNQFWFSIQSPTTGNNMGENDGATDPEDSQPYAMPLVYNATYIGSGMSSARTQSRGFHIRDNSGGYYKNCIITELGGAGLDIEDLDDAAAEDSRKRLESGEIQITNNIWYNIGGNTLEGIAPDVTGSKPYSQDFVRDYLAQNDNYIEDPMLAGISRTNNGGLDPRPNPGSAWTSDRAALPQGNNFFTNVNYIGAFGSDNWLEGWTFLSEAGFLGDFWVNSVERDETLTNNGVYVYPNPVENNMTIELNILDNSNVSLELYNAVGVKIVDLENKFLNAGSYSMNYDASALSTGVYFVRLNTNYGTYTYQVVVK